MATERIVYVTPSGQPTGETAPKLAAHNDHTRLHLAFSCYIFNDLGQLLVTQRAHTKKVWPGVWTNSVCGHPAPSESLSAAIARRASFELGMHVQDVTMMIANFTYKTPPFRGVVEHEFCPVFAARAASEVRANPDEVAAWHWQDWPAYCHALQQTPQHYSYWTKQQVLRLQTMPTFNSFLYRRHDAVQ